MPSTSQTSSQRNQQVLKSTISCKLKNMNLIQVPFAFLFISSHTSQVQIEQIMNNFAKNILKAMADNVEKVRENSIKLLNLYSILYFQNLTQCIAFFRAVKTFLPIFPTSLQFWLKEQIAMIWREFKMSLKS